MPILDDPVYAQAAIAGPVNQGLLNAAEPQQHDQPALDVLAAAARGNVGGALYDRVTTPDPDIPAAPPGWDPLDHVQGFEGYAKDLAWAQTPSQLEGMKQRIRRSQQDEEVLSKTGFWGKAGEMAFAGADPSFLASLAVPEIRLGKSVLAAKTATAIAHGAAAGAAYEGEMQALKEGRTAGESLYGIGSVALMSGVLGHLIARVPPSKMKPIYDAIEKEAELARSEAGAAAVARPTTLAEESLARGADSLSRAFAKTPLLGTDLDRIMASGNVSAHTAVQELADVPQMLTKNEAGIATPRSVESAVSKHDANLADFIDHAAEQWTDYAKRVPKDQRLSKREFYENIAKASRRGDSIGVPEIDSAAKFLRARIFDPLWERAQKLNLAETPEAAAAKPTHEITVEPDDTGGLSVKSPNGETIAQETDGYLRATRSDTAAAARKTGEGTARYMKLLDEAESRGLTLSSDVSVSPDQVGVYRRLKQMGLDVRENPHDVNPETGNLVSHDPRKPVFEVRKPPGFKPEGAPKVVGAQSYFRRMYDRDAIRANLSDWQGILYNHFAKSGDAIPAEIRAAVDDVTKTILHADVGQSNFASKVTVPAAGPLKERTLDIPDELIEKFLINDPQRVAQAYVRDLAPQVEMATRFGDVDMKGRLGEITDEFAIKREALRAKIQDIGPSKPEETAALNKQLEKLLAEEKDTVEAVVRVRDRVLGRAGRLSPDASEGARRAVQASRGWRNFVASGRLGGTAITGGIMDTAKIAAQYGFMPTVKKLTQLVKSKEFRELSTAQARRVGSAVEAALAKRVQVAYDGAITEGWTQTLANGVYKYTGLNHITDFNRTLAATLMEDTVLKAAGRVSEGKALPAFERARLASLGLGDKEMAQVAEQIAKHGGEVDGIRVSGSADWDNKALADIYDSAILKESKIAVQQPGAADRVWWMDKEIGKFIGQLKTFSLSSNARLLSGGLQMAGQGQYGKAARFFGYMMMGGYLTHVIRQAIAGKTPTTDPKTASFEAFSESGLGGVIPDLLSPVGRRLGVLGESVRYSDRNALSAYGGPALGAANDLYDFAFNRTQGGLSAKDLHMMRRMLPWNQVWWLRREINALEGEVAEGFDLQGADHATVGERLLRTDALPSTRDGAGLASQ